MVRPPAEKDEEREPEQHELDAQVDRAPLGELGGRRRRPEEEAQRVPAEEERRDRAVGREGDEREEDDAEPPVPTPRGSAQWTRQRAQRDGEREDTHGSWMRAPSRTCSMLSTSCTHAKPP